MTALAGVAILIVALVAGSVFLTGKRTPDVAVDSANSQANLETRQKEVASRQTFTRLVGNRYAKNYPGLSVTAGGVDGKVLSITHKSIGKNFETEFRKMENLNSLKQLGFTSIRISNGKGESIISL